MIIHRIRPRIPRIDMQHLMPDTSIRDHMRRQTHMIERLLRVLKRIRVPLPGWRVGLRGCWTCPIAKRRWLEAGRSRSR